MKRKISLFICALALMLTVLTAGAFAQTYVTDNDGLYSLPFTFEANNEYIVVVVRGHYDQTNYLEAYYEADDSDILYFEQKVSDENGDITFGPFAPNGYYDATVIVGGVTFEEPYLAGYLSVDGISNSAKIEVSGIEQTYTVAGYDGLDTYSEIEVEVFDTFGYPSVTDEEVKIELLNNDEGVSVEENTLVISRMAKAQTFLVKVSAGDASKTIYVQVNREPSVPRQIRVYADEECTEEFFDITVKGIVGAFEPFTVYAKTFDQYDEEVADEYQYVYGGKMVEQTFVPTLGVVSLTVGSKNSDLVTFAYVNAVARPDYQGSALELFELIKTAKGRLSEKTNISTNGKDVYADETWTTQANYDTFASAVSTAESALDAYGAAGYGDGDYSDEVTALTRALNTYNNSFNAGRRVDATSIRIDLQDIITTANTSVTVKAVSEPNLGLTTEELVWSSSDESVATVSSTTNNGGTAEIRAKASGKATITVTTRSGLTATTEITVVKKASEILLKTTSTTATYGETPVVLTATIKPTGCTDVITWSVNNPELADLEFNEYIDENNLRIIEATVIPKSAGKAEITVNAQYGQKSATKEITIKMQDWDKAASPVASVESGVILPGTTVELTSSTASADIYYTLDGTEPSKNNGRLYRAPITVNQSLTIKAVAVAEKLYNSDVVTYEYSVVNTGIMVSSADVEIGETAGVAVNVTGFENVNSAAIELVLDSAFTFEGFVSDYNVTVTEKSANVLEITYEKSEIALADGKLLTLNISVAESTPLGEYEISVTKANAHSDEFAEYQAATSAGVISVVDYHVGDANNDGEIGLADVLIIKQYLAGNESAGKTIVLGAADIDGDGDVDNDDVILLSKYCVGWNVEFGLKKNSNSDVRIVALSSVGVGEDGLFNYFYEVYDPFTSRKYEGVLPVANGAAKVSELAPAFETGAIVKANCDGKLNGKILANLDEANLVWIKSTSSHSMTVVPFTASAECKTCANEYVDFHTATLFKDIYGKEHNSNVVGITDETVFSVIKYSNYSENTFKYGIISPCDYETVSLESLNSKKNLLCYNERSLDAQENYKTTYSDYIKAFVSIGADGNADYVIIVANGNEAAAYNVPCESCNK